MRNYSTFLYAVILAKGYFNNSLIGKFAEKTNEVVKNQESKEHKLLKLIYEKNVNEAFDKLKENQEDIVKSTVLFEVLQSRYFRTLAVILFIAIDTLVRFKASELSENGSTKESIEVFRRNANFIFSDQLIPRSATILKNEYDGKEEEITDNFQCESYQESGRVVSTICSMTRLTNTSDIETSFTIEDYLLKSFLKTGTKFT